VTLLLAAVGVYQVIGYSVARRRNEIGIRMAFGAPRKNVLLMVLREGAGLAALGILIGGAAALGVMRFVVSFLYGVNATDPLTFVAVSVLLLAVALLASFVPAHHAMRVDPMVALRHE
jgi:putative ABC transport system permease protein